MTSFNEFDFRPRGKHPTLHFCLLSQAYYVDTNWGHGSPTRGVKKMGDIAHAHGIPVTFLVTGRSAEDMADLLTGFHEEFGDEVQQQLRMGDPGGGHGNDREVIESASVADFVRHIREDRKRIVSALPWAEGSLSVLGSGIRSENLILALKELGYEGIHGHCPFQLGVDAIVSYVSPFSAFYVGSDNYQCPALPGDSDPGIVGLEWTARDLCKSWHYAATEVYSTDPNDVQRGGICTDTNVEYWKDLTREWLRNVPLNGDLFFQMHQESHEMDGRHEVCNAYTQADVDFTADMMDLYFGWLAALPECLPGGNPETGVRVQFETASEHVRKYKRRSRSTPPTLAAFHELEVPRDLPYWEQVRAGRGYCGFPSKHAMMPSEDFYEYIQRAIDEFHFDGAPWTDSLAYYDIDCILLFDDSGWRNAPVWAANYRRGRSRPNVATEGVSAESLRGHDSDNVEWFQEEAMPEPTIEWDPASGKARVEVESQTEVPWGAVWWDDEAWRDASAVRVVEARTPARAWLVDGKAIFLRADLTPGTNEFVLALDWRG
ncbi:MAG: hypothetical protein ACTSU5_06380 [Promethearchaeota archaeon]